MSARTTAATVRAIACAAAASLAACLALPVVPAGAQSTLCAATPTLTFSSATIQVPVGAGSAKAPWVTVECNGAPLPDPDITVTLAPGTTNVTFGQSGAGEETVVGDAQGVAELPLITSALTTGPFTLSVQVDDATANLSGEVVGRLRGILPPKNPAHGLSFDEHTRPACSGVADYSTLCLDESVALINTGRRSEHLGPLILPSNWQLLSVPQQLFVLTDLERVARGLPPDGGLAPDWDAAASAGAQAGVDPTRAGSGAHGFGSVWAGGMSNPILAMLGWIYDDGFFRDGTTNNIDCSRTDQSGCWGHRVIELHDVAQLSCETLCVVGAGYSPNGFQGHASYAEVVGAFAGDNQDPPYFIWLSELPRLPRCERTADTCSWSDRPLLTRDGFQHVRGFPRGESPPVRPWFPIAWRGRVSSSGDVGLSVDVGYRVAGITALARGGRERISLRVRRLSIYDFTVAGHLPAGRWTITIRYRTPPVYGPAPSTVLHVTTPARL